jgi:hypothetical protein
LIGRSGWSCGTRRSGLRTENIVACLESSPRMQTTLSGPSNRVDPRLGFFNNLLGLTRFRGHLPSLFRHDERGIHESDEVVQAAQAPQVHA